MQSYSYGSTILDSEYLQTRYFESYTLKQTCMLSLLPHTLVFEFPISVSLLLQNNPVFTAYSCLIFLPSPQQKHELFRCLLYSGGAATKESSSSYSFAVKRVCGRRWKQASIHCVRCPPREQILEHDALSVCRGKICLKGSSGTFIFFVLFDTNVASNFRWLKRANEVNHIQLKRISHHHSVCMVEVETCPSHFTHSTPVPTSETQSLHNLLCQGFLPFCQWGAEEVQEIWGWAVSFLGNQMTFLKVIM